MSHTTVRHVKHNPAIAKDHEHGVDALHAKHDAEFAAHGHTVEHSHVHDHTSGDHHGHTHGHAHSHHKAA